jgi:hypothetical protein
MKRDEQAIFDVAVRENVHLTVSDVPLLMVYARAIAGALNADDASDFEKLSRAAASMGTKLRLTQQSRIRPETLGRRMAEQDSGPKPWDRVSDDDEDEV